MNELILGTSLKIRVESWQSGYCNGLLIRAANAAHRFESYTLRHYYIGEIEFILSHLFFILGFHFTLALAYPQVNSIRLIIIQKGVHSLRNELQENIFRC